MCFACHEHLITGVFNMVCVSLEKVVKTAYYMVQYNKQVTQVWLQVTSIM